MLHLIENSGNLIRFIYYVIYKQFKKRTAKEIWQRQNGSISILFKIAYNLIIIKKPIFAFVLISDILTPYKNLNQNYFTINVFLLKLIHSMHLK